MIGAALARFMTDDRGRCLAALAAEFRDLDLAEEALSAAVETALEAWPCDGTPEHPRGWILAVARRRAIDRLRRQARGREVLAQHAILAGTGDDTVSEIPDARLGLIFACCHPALDAKSRVALTLRTLGGLTTGEIARAFLDREAAMGQRLTRAKTKIREARIPFAVPGPEDWDVRLESVLRVLYLIFNEGYSRTEGAAPLRIDLCEEAIWLGRMLRQLRPDEPEILGLLALMLSVHARRHARFGPDGAVIALDRQDPRRWDGPARHEAETLLDEALRLGRPGPCQIKAAISCLHMQSAPGAADWRQIVLLYDSLLRHEPTPVVRLNRAAALCELGALREAEAELATLAEALEGYQPFHALRADIAARRGDTSAARASYARAIGMAGTSAERDFLR